MHKSPPRLVNRDRAGCLHTNTAVSSWDSSKKAMAGKEKNNLPSTTIQEQMNPACFRHWKKTLPVATGLFLSQAQGSVAISSNMPPATTRLQNQRQLSVMLGPSLQHFWQWKAAGS